VVPSVEQLVELGPALQAGGRLLVVHPPRAGQRRHVAPANGDTHTGGAKKNL
jgi:hypothetical protein